ncbi:hypothetical protein [Mycoplasma todarodis]|uniref:Lipoprotein n=1 Tax=Mycoplasma todarodis TaxID=1937191 RepID=A0A4R0XK68_9MOLU|nr:hypothetical protein [Mycoplasma todarodis]TCG11033.1 hypothetical protein C4B25_02460 [Mycoplasma todarodis]
MNISKKQISLGALAAVAVVAVPVATTISCGKKEDKKEDKKDDSKNQVDANVIELSKMKSVEELVETINSKLKLAMPERADLMAVMENGIGKLKESSFNKIKKYMDGMNPNNFKELIVKVGNEEIKWDLKNLLKNVEIVKNSLNKGYAKIKSAPVIDGSSEVPSAGGMVAMLGGGDGMTFGLALTGFSTLEGNGYDGYNGILDAYHEFAKKIISSKGFLGWMNDKTYEVISYKYEWDMASARKFTIADTNSYKVGEGFDKQEVRDTLPGLVNSPTFKTEGNNLEAQWIAAILKMA